MRNEKKLLALPWPKCPAIVQLTLAEKDKHSRFYFHRIAAELHNIGGEAYLAITVFNMDGGPERRYWLSATQRGMQVHHAEKAKYSPERSPGVMYGASIDNEMKISSYWGSEDVLYSTAAEEKLVLEFTKSKEKSIGKALEKFCSAQRKSENEARPKAGAM